MTEKDRFECLFCRRPLEPDLFHLFCPDCGEPLFMAPRMAPGEASILLDETRPFKRFRDFLPLDHFNPDWSLGEGGTPLVPLHNLGEASVRFPLLAKNEMQNPTGSFKDRGSALAVQKAASLGFGRIGTVSTGNMAASTAAYGAKAGLETYVLIKEGASPESLRAAGIFGPKLVAVQGDYGRLFYDSLEAGRRLGIYFMNSIHPFRVEGYKLTGFEIFLQLGRRAPGCVVVPVSSGGHLLGLVRAFEDLGRQSLLDRFPVFIGVQPEACAPIAAAFEAGWPKCRPVEIRPTIAHGISNPSPPGGNAVLKMVREHGGVLMSVSDSEMLDAQRSLAASEGLFCQPESAAALAGWRRLLGAGEVKEGEVVLILTGSGLKAPRALESQPIPVHRADVEHLQRDLEALSRGSSA